MKVYESISLSLYDILYYRPKIKKKEIIIQNQITVIFVFSWFVDMKVPVSDETFCNYIDTC